MLTTDAVYFQALEEKLTTKHMGDMQVQMLAHKTTVEAVKSSSDRDKQLELEAQQEQFTKEMGE